MNKDIIKVIKQNEFLICLFWFISDDENDFNDMFINEEQKNEFSEIEWLYWSEHPYATLIGLMKNDSIFTIDDEFEQNILCSSFFDIPFKFTKIIVETTSFSLDSLFIDPIYEENLNDLKKYIKWCEENNFKLRKEDIDWINNN